MRLQRQVNNMAKISVWRDGKCLLSMSVTMVVQRLAIFTFPKTWSLLFPFQITTEITDENGNIHTEKTVVETETEESLEL